MSRPEDEGSATSAQPSANGQRSGTPGARSGGASAIGSPIYDQLIAELGDPRA